MTLSFTCSLRSALVGSGCRLGVCLVRWWVVDGLRRLLDGWMSWSSVVSFSLFFVCLFTRQCQRVFLVHSAVPTFCLFFVCLFIRQCHWLVRGWLVRVTVRSLLRSLLGALVGGSWFASFAGRLDVLVVRCLVFLVFCLRVHSAVQTPFPFSLGSANVLLVFSFAFSLGSAIGWFFAVSVTSLFGEIVGRFPNLQ